MRVIREAAVAGLFYPDEPSLLKSDVQYRLSHCLPDGRTDVDGQIVPKALIVPHAGYQYSGDIAAQAYATLAPHYQKIKRVLLLGPSHRVGFRGIAFCGADAYHTPLGDVPVDQRAFCQISDLPRVTILDDAHRLEHSLEVQLPFLQCLLPTFSIVPLIVGDASTGEVSNVLDALWGGPETLIIISTDLSHFLNDETARKLDQTTRQAIEQLAPEDIEYEQACGRNPVKGLLDVAQRKSLSVTTLAMGNSADTSGDTSRVVGYGAWALYERTA